MSWNIHKTYILQNYRQVVSVLNEASRHEDAWGRRRTAPRGPSFSTRQMTQRLPALLHRNEHPVSTARVRTQQWQSLLGLEPRSSSPSPGTTVTRLRRISRRSEARNVGAVCLRQRWPLPCWQAECADCRPDPVHRTPSRITWHYLQTYSLGEGVYIGGLCRDLPTMCCFSLYLTTLS
jgi:hypothetical protein